MAWSADDRRRMRERELLVAVLRRWRRGRRGTLGSLGVVDSQRICSADVQAVAWLMGDRHRVRQAAAAGQRLRPGMQGALLRAHRLAAAEGCLQRSGASLCSAAAGQRRGVVKEKGVFGPHWLTLEVFPLFGDCTTICGRFAIKFGRRSAPFLAAADFNTPLATSEDAFRDVACVQLERVAHFGGI